MNYEPFVEKIMQHFTSALYVEEVAEAKEDFFKWAGIFDEETSDFEMKMAQFMDWFIFTRPLSRYKTSPISRIFVEDGFEITKEEHQYYQNLASNRHSLFEFLKLRGDELHIRDLFSGYKMVLKKTPFVHGFVRDELFEARLFPHEDHFVFSSAFCIHPAQARRFILSEVKKLKKLKDEEILDAREALMLRLFRMRHKFDQYRHVGLNEIYSNDSKIRF